MQHEIKVLEHKYFDSIKVMTLKGLNSHSVMELQKDLDLLKNNAIAASEATAVSEELKRNPRLSFSVDSLLGTQATIAAAAARVYQQRQTAAAALRQVTARAAAASEQVKAENLSMEDEDIDVEEEGDDSSARQSSSPINGHKEEVDDEENGATDLKRKQLLFVILQLLSL